MTSGDPYKVALFLENFEKIDDEDDNVWWKTS